MKKLLALFLILLLMFSAFGCAKADEETSAEAGLVDTPAPQPEKNPELEQKPVIKEPQKDAVPQPLEFTINDDFSPYEVVVRLTAQESAKGKTYSCNDFPTLDIFNVFAFDYYPEQIYPQHKDKTTLFLMLDTPSKQTVVEYVQKLKNDPRVEYAEPNINSFDADYIKITVTENVRNQMYAVGTHYFREIDAYSVVKPAAAYDEGIIFLQLKNSTGKDYIVEQIKGAMNNDSIASISPNYSCIADDRLVVTWTIKSENDPALLSVNDFTEVDVKRIEPVAVYNMGEGFPKTCSACVYLKNVGKKEVLVAMNRIKQNSKIDSVSFDYISVSPDIPITD